MTEVLLLIDPQYLPPQDQLTWHEARELFEDDGSRTPLDPQTRKPLT